jgi:hypothetical protein
VRKRSKYRPKKVLADPIGFVLSGMQPLPQLKEQFLMIQIKNREALEQVRIGRATKDDVDRLISMANMSESLAIHGKGNDWLKEINESQHHLHALAERGVKLGMRFVMKAAEWEALKLITDLHEVQLKNCTVYDIERACDYVEKRLRAGSATLIPLPSKEDHEQEPKDS